MGATLAPEREPRQGLNVRVFGVDGCSRTHGDTMLHHLSTGQSYSSVGSSFVAA